MRPYEGLFTAMVTPFTPDGNVNEEAVVALGQHLLATGSHGLVIAATTGEATTLTADEHLELIRLMIGEFEGQCPIIASTGSNNTAHAVWMTEQAIMAGADGVLSVTPYYNKPNRRGLLRHFRAVAEAAGGRPVVLYNNPTRTALNMDPDLLAELAQIDGIEAVKQANPDQLELIDGLALLAGDDNTLAAVLDIGGAGGICVASHVAGKEMRRMIDEPDQRSAIDERLQILYSALSITTNPIPIKAALNLLGHDVGGVRLPLDEADHNEVEQIREALVTLNLLEGVPIT